MKKKTAIIFLVILIAALVFIFNFSYEKKEQPVNDDKLINISTKLYFLDEFESFLTAKEISFKVKEDKEKYAYVLKSLINGPNDDALYPTISPKTEFLDINVENGLCIINFNNTLLEYNLGGSSKEMMCLYSVVNTLCEFPEIERVIFKINGESIEIFGHFDMTEPYKKNISIVR